MLSTCPAHLFKDKYLHSFVSDVPLENQKLRGKRAQEMLTSGKVSLQEWPSMEIPAKKIQLTMEPLVTWAKAENCQDLTETPGIAAPHCTLQQDWVHPTFSAETALGIKTFSCLERDVSAVVQHAYDYMKLTQPHGFTKTKVQQILQKYWGFPKYSK